MRKESLCALFFSANLLIPNIALAQEKEVYFTRDGVIIPADEISVWIASDKFDIEALKERIQNKPGYRLEVHAVEEEEGGGQSVTVSYKGDQLYNVVGNFKTAQIREIVSSAKRSFSPSGVKVGDDLVEKVGKRLKCSFELVGYCKDPDVPNIVYYVALGESSHCKSPEAREEFDGNSLVQYELFNCLAIEAIGLYPPNRE